MTTLSKLPPPKAEAIARSQTLRDYIRQRIDKQDAKLTFADFMHQALYHPTLGYYNADTFSIGARGDFVTAPELSPIFAQCFAAQCAQIFAALGCAQILELGAGSGRFAHDLIAALAQTAPVQRYYIYEPNIGLRQQQEAFLQTHCVAVDRIEWLDTLPKDFCGVIIANEVLDALPVHRFRVQDGNIHECFVKYEGEDFVWQHGEPESAGLASAVEDVRMQLGLAENYTSDINLGLAAFVQQLCDSLQAGVILFADYGYGRAEYYHPDRDQGTLTCFYQHHRHTDPLILPGLQDITAHVDFTAVIEAADAAGCTLAGYVTQAGFLLACGLSERVHAAEQSLSPVAQFELHQAVKVLTFPSEMGEVIKVMALSKQMPLPLIGFNLQDRRRYL